MSSTIIPDQFDLVQDYGIRTGTNWSLYITLKDSAGDIVDLIGYKARMQIRKSKIAPPIITFDSETGGIVLGDSDDNIAIVGTPDKTDVQPGCYDYDLRMESDENKQHIYIYGRIDIVQSVTDIIT